MSASSPPSTMLRAATATSGGTDAPLLTYCSLCPWMEAMSSSISSFFSALSSMSSTRASRCGSVWTRSSRRMRRCPWTMARIVPSWRRMTWAILARVPIVYSSSVVLISSCSLERWVTRATGCEARTARSSALTLRSRPTWRGTIISGKITVSRRATSGRTCTRSSWAPPSSVASISGMSWDFLSLSDATSGCSFGERGLVGLVGLGILDLVGKSLDIVLIEQVVDPDLAECLELKDDPYAGEVDTLPAGEETDDTNALDIGLAIEAQVVPSLRLDEAFLLVDPQRSRMAARQLGGDADDVTGSGELVATRGSGRRRLAPRSVHVRTPRSRRRSSCRHLSMPRSRSWR